MEPCNELVSTMESTNGDAAWAAAKVRELLREAVAWLLLVQLAELGIGPPP
jgi:hypothetical protein